MIGATEQQGRLNRPAAAGGGSLAWARVPGATPGVVFLGGYRSDMTGSKALALRDWCALHGRAFLRFDYSGHGASDGVFEDGTIGTWADDAALALDRLTEGPQVLVGSSMGGWIALLLALRRPGRVAGLIGIAPAPDFTEDLMWPGFDEATRHRLMTEGVVHLPSQYGDPTPVTRGLIEDGRRHLLLGGGAGSVKLPIPVRLLHGQRDPDVPWRHSLRTAEALAGDDVQVTLVKDGDHRLSRQEDLALLTRTLDALLRDIKGDGTPQP